MHPCVLLIALSCAVAVSNGEGILPVLQLMRSQATRCRNEIAGAVEFASETDRARISRRKRNRRGG